MRWQRALYPVISIIFMACACFSCTSGGKSGDNSMPPYEVVDKELIGSWAGYFLSGNSTYNADNLLDPLDPDNLDRIFVIGIITRNPGARFIGDVSQFVCYENSFGIYDFTDSKTFSSTGVYYYTWNTNGLNFGTPGPAGDDYLATVRKVQILGSTIYSNDILDGVYFFDTDHLTYWEFQLLNYSNSEIYPDVKKLAGTWEISNSFVVDPPNTLTLVMNTTGAPAGEINVDGHDGRGNAVTGTIVEIRYTVTSETVPATEIYSVDLQLNGGIDHLEGLATYIESMDSSGLKVDKTLAIGATNSNHLITGMAKKLED